MQAPFQSLSGASRAIAEHEIVAVEPNMIRYRALFLLHENVFEKLVKQSSSYRAKQRAALDCVSQLMVDVARTHTRSGWQTRLERALTGVYNTEAAIRHLRCTQHQKEVNTAVLESLVELEAFDALYAARWKPFNSVLST